MRPDSLPLEITRRPDYLAKPQAKVSILVWGRDERTPGARAP